MWMRGQEEDRDPPPATPTEWARAWRGRPGGVLSCAWPFAWGGSAGSRLGTPWARPGAQASAGKGRRPTECFDLSDWSPLTMRIGRERGGGLYDSRDANYTQATSVNRPDFVFKGISRTLDPALLNMLG